MAMPVETVVIRSDATATETVVLRIPPTIGRHNVMKEVLKYIRTEHPGVWLEFLSSVAKERAPIGEPVAKAEVKTSVPKQATFDDVPM